jgi:hypothetical protein
MKKAAVPSILVAVVLLAVGVIAEAQQPKKVHRMGYLSNSDSAAGSGWNYSRMPFPNLPVSRFSTIRPLRALLAR